MTDSKSNPTITRVQLSLLRIGKRHRAVDKHKVASFAKSMAAIGLQTPISVYDDGTAVHLVAGLHRVKAAMSLGWEHIDGIVVELDEVDREIWEIDENLMRAGLSKAEEREHFKRRKELWAKRPKNNSGAAAPKSAGRPKGFAAETAAATGRSKSHINRCLAEAKAGAGAMKKVAKAKGAKERLDDLSDELGALVAPKGPAPKETCRAPLPHKPRLETQHMGVIKARRLHVDEAVNVGVDVEGEIELFADELRQAARKRAGNGADIGAKERRTA